MKTIQTIIFGSLLIFSSAYADTETPFGRVKSVKSGIQYVNDNGLLIDAKGVQDKDSGLHVPKAMLNKARLYRTEMQKSGYINHESDFVPDLLNQRRSYTSMLRESDKIHEKYDTHLHRKLSDLKLSFQFHGLPDIKKEDIIGYAVSGSYIKKPGKQEGWDGAGVLFESKSIGSCRFTYNHIISAYVDMATAAFDINKKPTETYVEGTPHTGFLYTVLWYSDKTNKEQMTLSNLRCASKKLDKNTIPRMIDYAKKIDAAQDQKS